MGWVTVHMQRGVVILSQLELAVVGYLSWGKCQRGSRFFFPINTTAKNPEPEADPPPWFLLENL